MNCEICGESIVPGEAREPAPNGGVKHVACGATDPPDTPLSRADPTDALRVRINGEWVTATVEGMRAPPGEYIVRFVVRDGLVPGGTTDQFDLVVTEDGDYGWTDPVCHEIIPDNGAMEAADDLEFHYETEEHGTVEVAEGTRKDTQG